MILIFCENYARRNNLTDQFQVYVRDELYRFQQQPQEPTTLSGLVDLLKRSTEDQNGWHIPLVATFNARANRAMAAGERPNVSASHEPSGTR